jgi:malate dehydrogenase (oxaloacetate-decarboxylating)
MPSQSKALKYSAQDKLAIDIKAPLKSQQDLSLAYTPGIAEVAKLIQTDESAMFTYTFRRNNLAVISDGSAVLGLGNIGHKAGYPIMEGKAMLFKRFGGINAIPIVIKTQESDQFVHVVEQIADSFAAINLEDIGAPRCFEIEAKLKQSLDIPLMHDDQHGTAIVILAAVLNALKLQPKQGLATRFVISGAGAAGVAITRILLLHGFKNILVADSTGIIHRRRTHLGFVKQQLANSTNPGQFRGSLKQALTNADVFIGVSTGNLLTTADIKRMNPDSIVIAMANPDPEILPHEAKKGGAAIVATGRSDVPNQVNNALAFPGVFRGAIDARSQITENMKLAASQAIIDYHQRNLAVDALLPKVMDEKVHHFIANRVQAAANSKD